MLDAVYSLHSEVHIELIVATKLEHSATLSSNKFATANASQFVYTSFAEHSYSLVANNLTQSIMNFRIKNKEYDTWHPALIWLYENVPHPFNWIFWKLEQLRTPKVFYYEYDDVNDRVKLIKVK